MYLNGICYLDTALKEDLKIAVIGGGLAGLTAALHLRKAGYDIQLFEKEELPRHKVCGEYISNEILPYWSKLGIDPFLWGAVPITGFEFTTAQGKALATALPLGGFGISRYTLDFNILGLVKNAGCRLLREQVTAINFNQNAFEIHTLSGKHSHADLVIGAFGKRSNLDISLSRKFMSSKTPWLGVKGHYQADIEKNKVSLHNFEGGYCGISRVENNRVNVCYLTHLDAFKTAGNLQGFQKQVLEKNPHLHNFFAEAEPLFEKPLSISQVSFQPKNLVENHVLMCGDSAGLIHPLCGNGMAMAVVGAKILSECIIAATSSTQTRAQLEQEYATRWNREFKSRLRAGRMLQRLLQNQTATRFSLAALRKFPFLMKQIVQTTHGKTLVS